MAKREDTIVNNILAKPTDKDFISRMVESQKEEFPAASDIEVTYKYQDPFEFPKWCDQEVYAFAWADLRDDITRHRVLEVSHFKIVNRMSSCIIAKFLNNRDFRDHGAVERQGQFLVYRPKDIDNKLRTYPVLRHEEMARSLAAGKSAEGYDISSKKGADSSKIEVVAAEEAGTEGIKFIQ